MIELENEDMWEGVREVERDGGWKGRWGYL